MAQSTGWTVSEAAGTVIVRDGSGDRPVRRGTVIAEGATLSTGPGARAVVVRGKDFMTVNANSRVRIPVPADKRGMFDVLQEWGNALFRGTYARPMYEGELRATIGRSAFAAAATPPRATSADGSPSRTMDARPPHPARQGVLRLPPPLRRGGVPLHRLRAGYRGDRR